MIPIINDTSFGSIVVSHKIYDHDIVIRLDGSINKRKKKLSKAVYGTSHVVSEEEMANMYEPDAELIVVGSGQFERLSLSNEAKEFLKQQACGYEIMATPKAVDYWNSHDGKFIGLYHVTC